MNFRKHGGCWVIEPTIHKDSRGSLAQTCSTHEFDPVGLNTCWPEQLQTITRGCGSVRGMHWQAAPHAQTKLVRCILGLVTDVVVDIRPDSPAFGKPVQFELSGDDMRSLYIPVGFAHGFQCISEYCIMHYCLSAPYNPNAVRRFHHADPAVGIKWPVLVMHVSEADTSAPSLSDALHHS